MDPDHTVAIVQRLVLFLGILTVATEEKAVIQKEFSGHDGDHIRLTFSPTANPVSSLYGDVFIYKFRNLDAINSTVPCYVRLTFTVFHFPKERAVFKIYDGADTNGHMTVFTGDTRPFYQSLQPQLYMIMKFHDVTTDNTQPEFDGFVTFTREYRGTWRKTYPPGDGLGWRDRFLPTTAYCKSLKEFREGGSSGCVAYPGNKYPHDCYWRLKMEKEVKLVIGWNRLSMMIVDKHFTVTNGTEAELVQFNPKSLEPRVIRRPVGHNPRVLMEFTGTIFHIHLFLFLANYDVAFGYHESRSGAVELLEQELERKVSPDCPFKRCADGTCTMHWDACEDRYKGTDASCDEALSTLMDSRCGTQCYNDEWDTCDTIQDCGGGQDESSTKYSAGKEKDKKKKQTPDRKTDEDEDEESDKENKRVFSGVIPGCLLVLFCIAIGACRWCICKSCEIGNSILKCCSHCMEPCCDAVDRWQFSCENRCQSCWNRCQTGCQSCWNQCQTRCQSCVSQSQNRCQNCLNQCQNCYRRAPRQPRAPQAQDEIERETPPPAFDPAWTTGIPPPPFDPAWSTDLPAVVYTAPQNPPASNIQHTDIEPPSYTDVVASVPDHPSSQARQAPTGSPRAITRQPGSGTSFRAPLLEGDAPPPSYSTVAPSVPSTRTDTSPGRAGTVRPVGYREPDRARPTDQSTDRLRQGNTSEPPPPYDSVWD